MTVAIVHFMVAACIIATYVSMPFTAMHRIIVHCPNSMRVPATAIFVSSVLIELAAAFRIESTWTLAFDVLLAAGLATFIAATTMAIKEAEAKQRAAAHGS